MNKIVHYIGLDVHKDSIAVSIAPQHSTEVRRYGVIGGVTSVPNAGCAFVGKGAFVGLPRSARLSCAANRSTIRTHAH